jgi:hypothetical protein
MALAKTLQIPWLVSFYGADVYQLGYQEQWREIYAAVFESAAKVLAVGPAMAARLEKLGCPSDKLAVHLLGVDAAGLPFEPRKLGVGEPLRLLFAGTFREKRASSTWSRGRLARREPASRWSCTSSGEPWANREIWRPSAPFHARSATSGSRTS